MKRQRFYPTYTLLTRTSVAGTCSLSLEASICCRLGPAEKRGRRVYLVLHSRVGQTNQPLQGYEEVIVPPAKVIPPSATERQITVAELDPLARGSFPVSCETRSSSRILRFPRATPH